MQMQDKEKWISEVMSSLDGMAKPSVDPFLYEKIRHKMERGDAPAHTFQIHAMRWAAALLLLLAVNGFSIFSMIKKDSNKMQQDTEMQSVLPDMPTQTIYNY